MNKTTCIGLFGTCGNSTWRTGFIKKYEELGISYFNPQVPEWDPSCAANEARHLADDDILIYPILSETYGIASLAESGYAVAQALKPGSIRHILLFVESEVNDQLKEKNPQLADESRRARHLVIAHLDELKLPTVHTAQIREYVRASTHLTHTDPKAETAALAVALTASWSAQGLPPEGDHFDEIRRHWISAGADDPDWLALIQKIAQAIGRRMSVSDFARELGLSKGVTGYAYHTVPVALYAWARHYGNFRAGLEAVLNCGGDTDTVGAITGALLAINGTIPEDWSSGLCDYPISRAYLEKLALALESRPDEINQQIPSFAWAALPFRNLVFLSIVIAHVFRRLIP